MSNALAIATVTTTLAQIVRSAAQSIVPGAEVLTERPDGAASGQARIRLFMYQVSPNPALRNNDLPVRSGDGKLLRRPTAALDLHYLLAFYGNETQLETQRMLGAVARDLQTQAVLGRQMITDAVASQSFLTGSNLAEAVEQIKFTPLPLSLEELSKLWSVFFQTPYVLSMAYQASVVLIESEERIEPAPQVLRRGKEDRGVDSLLGPLPLLDGVHIGAADEVDRRPRAPSYPSAQLGALITLGGINLNGDIVLLRFSHPRIKAAKDVVIPQANRTATEIRLTLPDDAAAQTEWVPGLYTLSAIVKDGGSERSTNLLPLKLAPKITKIAPDNPIQRDANNNVTLTLTCAPQVLPEQRVTLLVSDREVAAEPHAARTDTLQFKLESAPVIKEAVVRLRVDGVDSLPFKRQDAPPPPRLVFDDKQKVTIQ
jgi:hypothetical protein